MSMLRAVVGLVLYSGLLAASAPDAQHFEKAVIPFLTKNCLSCHNDKVTKGGLNFRTYPDVHSVEAGRDQWERVLEKLKRGEMPPPPIPKPPSDELANVTKWLEQEFARQDKGLKPDPGKVTARRLNRYEYNNTVRDLLGVDFRPGDDFPVDPFGYGFDNIGEVLTMSPTLMEKYLTAARRIARIAIEPEPVPKKAMVEHHKNLTNKLVFEWNRRFTWEADYEIRFSVPFLIEERTDPCEMMISFDGEEPKRYPVPADFQNEGRFVDVRRHMTAGVHSIKAWLIRDTPASIAIAWKKEQDRIERMKKAAAAGGNGANLNRRQMAPAKTESEVTQWIMDTPPYLEFIEVRGPYNAAPAPRPEGYARIFLCKHKEGEHDGRCARTNTAAFAARAWRRPAQTAEVAKLVSHYNQARSKGATVDEAMRVVVTAVLVSPHFLFRIEEDPAPEDAKTARRVNDYELAARLAYFLWSSMPDDELTRLAAQGKLRQPAVLQQQAFRMLRDPKSEALVDNFGGQWLQVRNIDSVKPDPDKFPVFTEQLRQAMKEETRLFFSNIIGKDLSIVDFLTARYSFLNGPLARFYGIKGVDGDEFRRVDLSGTPRIGVLTHGSVLTVSSYTTRTSPVVRGKWILENILNTPPPPPPADVPALDDTTVGVSGTLRQQMEKHRSNPACSGCHAKMDPLGFGLENFDAVGRYRTHDGKLPIDSVGTLPDGRGFSSPVELAKVLEADKAEFGQGLAEKMLTFALGRSLQRFDRPVVKSIVQKLAADNYRFSTLVTSIVTSLPFRMKRGEAPRPGSSATAKHNRRAGTPTSQVSGELF